MTLKTRRILYLLFFLIFFILSPLIMFYASGYSIGAGFRLQKTGILVLDTEPKGAKIFIDGQAAQRFLGKIFDQETSFLKTPYKIKNIKPGEHLIELKINGYWDWKKKLEIRPGETTFAEDIYLFKNTDATLISPLLNASSSNYSYLAKQEKFIDISFNQALLVDLKSKKSSWTKINNNSTSTKFCIAGNGQKIINNANILSLDDWGKPKNISALIGANIKKSCWGEDNFSQLYYLNEDTLFSFNLSTQKNKEVIKQKKIDTYLLKGKYVHFIYKDKQSSILETRDTHNNKLITKLELPLADYSFKNTKYKYLNLYNTSHAILYLIDPLSSIKNVRQIIYQAKIIHFVGQNKLIYSDGFEIWLLDIKTGTKILLTRISKKISSLLWHPSNNYIIFSTDQDINILELDNRDRRNITELIKFPHIKNLFSNKKGDELYFVSSEKNKTGLYKIFIQ